MNIFQLIYVNLFDSFILPADIIFLLFSTVDQIWHLI